MTLRHRRFDRWLRLLRATERLCTRIERHQPGDLENELESVRRATILRVRIRREFQKDRLT